jgi:hypothetical protein
MEAKPNRKVRRCSRVVVGGRDRVVELGLDGAQNAAVCQFWQ